VGTEIIFQHGWAFDATSWSLWANAFGKGATVLLGERGYFGARKFVPQFSKNADRKIIIAHSFGAHLIAAEALRECDTLVLIGAFRSLSHNARAIRAMLKKFPANPEQVVVDFWRNCYLPECAGISLLPPPGMNETALEDDLAAMQESELDVVRLAAIPHVVLIQTLNDRIVPEQTQLQLSAALPDAEVVEIAGAGHAVHLTQADMCLQLITHWVTRKQSEECQTQKL
jgi:pimeloyl-ACP methyl ester carboxylesterase